MMNFRLTTIRQFPTTLVDDANYCAI